jgi:hypothetical protein
LQLSYTHYLFSFDDRTNDKENNAAIFSFHSWG